MPTSNDDRNPERGPQGARQLHPARANLRTPEMARAAEHAVINDPAGIKEEECYVLIGECYVHGMMDGEGFARADAAGNPGQLFSLV